jgi:hypothetical protein
VVLCQPHIAQCGLQSLSNNAVIAQANLVYAGESVRGDSIANAVHDENPDTRQCQVAFFRPFDDQMGRDERQRCESAALCKRKNAAQ